MKKISQLGFSLIYLESLSTVERKYLDKNFHLFDVAIGQMGMLSSDKVLSVQSIFHGENLEGISLVEDENSFIRLKHLVEKQIIKISSNGYSSAIFGSPLLRKNISGQIVDISIINERSISLVQLASNYHVDLLFEALPNSFCDFCNDHRHLFLLNEKIHVDFATMIEMNEDIHDLVKIKDKIKRFHLSIPGYSYNFRDFPFIVEWTKMFLEFRYPGTIEVQQPHPNYSLINEIEWLKQEIVRN